MIFRKNSSANTKKDAEAKDKPRTRKVSVHSAEPQAKEVEVNKVEAPKALPVFEGKQVLRVLKDGRETNTHYHCDLEGGTTGHVPRELFD